MKILDLPLKKEWYDMIESGKKLEEYREIKEFWIKRLTICKGNNNPDKTGFYCKKANCISCIKRGSGFNPMEYTHVRFRYGYTNRTMLFELKNIYIGVGNPEWGAPEKEEVFILKLGEKINELSQRIS